MATPHENDIRDRAYALWQEEGSPEGRNDEFWHRAERELAEESGLDTSQEAADISLPTPPAGLPVH